MKRKQLLCVLLALLLVLQTGWAAEAGPADSVINVLLPSGGQVVIKPYGLAVPTWDGESHEQIVHAPQVLVNLSNFPVIVNAAVTGTRPVDSEAVFVPSPPFPDVPDKEVFLYAEFQDQPEWWTGSYSGLPNQLVVSEWGGFQENVLTLDAQGEGWFRLFGELSTAPMEPWGEEDVFGAVLIFTFAPLYPDPEPVEEPETPEEEIPEEPENPDIPEDVPPEDSVPPDVPEEDPPEEITPPDITEEDPAPPEEEPEAPDTPDPDTPEEPGPETPDEVEPPEGPEAPADPSEPPASPDEEAVDGTDEKTENS